MSHVTAHKLHTFNWALESNMFESVVIVFIYLRISKSKTWALVPRETLITHYKYTPTPS